MSALQQPKHFNLAGLALIPEKLLLLPQAITWVAGVADPVTGKFKKIPKGKNGSGKAWTKPVQWFRNLNDAVKLAQERGHSGPGVVLPATIDGQHLVALDWDGVDFNDTQRTAEIMQDWEALGRPYIEISPSGKGLRAFVLSTVSVRDASRARTAGGKDELFCSSKARWMTVTGNVFKAGGLPDATVPVLALSKRWNEVEQPLVEDPTGVARSGGLNAQINKPQMFAHLLPGGGFAWPKEPLKDGDGREEMMLRFAHSLRGKGYLQTEIETECLKARTERYAPGHELTDATVLDRARRGMRSLEEEATSVQVRSRASTVALLTDVGERLNDAGNADRFFAQYGDEVRYVLELRSWLRWRDGHWRFDNSGDIMGMAEDVARSLFTEAGQTQNQATRGLVARWASASLQITRLKAMVELAQPKLAVSVTELDGDPWLLGVQNGVVNLRNGTFRPSERQDLITKLANVAFDLQATCPFWESFLSSSMNGNQALLDLLQVAAGYSLSGSTSEQVFFFLHGAGANGKSTFVNAIRELMGANGIQSPSETIMVQRTTSASGPSPDIARLAGVRFVAMVETEDGQRLAESRLKQLTGGDAMTARVLYGTLFDFIPVLKLWLSGNHKPVIRGDDYGIWRRIVLIPFEVILPKERRDKHLPERLRTEFPGVLNWLIRGCLIWQKSGLKIPIEVAKQVEQYKSSMDLLAQWLADRCVQETHAQCGARAAYQSFARWCKEGGHNPISEVRFSQKMTERGYASETNRNGKVYLGLGAAQSELVFRFSST